jgi:hypothetical protein
LVTARQARDLAAAAGQEEIARAARERMEGYEVNKPFRQK